MSIRPYRSAAVALVLAAAAASPAFAQRVIRIVVPFGPGAVQDTVARTFNAELGQILNASVVVENRPGAGGTVGTAGVAPATASRWCWRLPATRWPATFTASSATTR
jgi:tripartite-type tricarboxylate transporter receptor subunit TctC